MLSQSSHRLAITAGATALFSLIVFLFDRPENASWDVSIAECELFDSSNDIWQWRMPESAQWLISAKTPRRDSSFLFFEGRLVPLEYPFDELDADERDQTGWHRIHAGLLQFELPAGHSMETEPPIEPPGASRLRLEVTGTMSTARQIACALFIIAALVLGLTDKKWSRTIFSDQAVIVIAATVPAMIVASLIGTAFYPLPYAWSDARLGTAVNRLDAVLPGLILLHAVVGWIQNRCWQVPFNHQLTPSLSGKGSGPLRRGKKNNEIDASPTDQVPLRIGSQRFVRYGWLAAVALVLFSFVRMSSWGLAATAAWSPVETSSPFASSVSYSDAEGYLAGAYQLTSTGTLDPWNQRRPINATLLATRLALSNWNVDIAKWIQAFAAALAMAWVAREMASLFGWRSAWASIALMLGCGRLFLITTLSEPLGFTLGCLALVGWLRQLHHGCMISGLAGLGFMTLAQGARPGALFILPAVAIWVACHSIQTISKILSEKGQTPFRIGSKTQVLASRGISFAITGLVAIIFLGANPLLSQIYGTGENLTGSNFSHTFAGLASGQSWAGVMTEYEAEIAKQPNEKEVARFLYAEGFRLIQDQPHVILRELAKGIVQFGIELPRFLTSITARSTIDSLGLLLGLQMCGLLMLTTLAIWRQWTDATASESWFWLLAAAGWMASVPFIFLDGGLRVLIATWPVALAWLATGIADPSSSLARGLSQDLSSGDLPGNHRSHRSVVPIRWCLVALLISVVATAAGGPALLRLSRERIDADLATNDDAVTISQQLSFDHRLMGPGVLVSDDLMPAWSPIRVMNLAQWQRAWQRSGIGSASCLLTHLPDAPFQLHQIFQLGSGRTRTLFRPLRSANDAVPLVRTGEMEVTLCGEGELFGRVIRIFP